MLACIALAFIGASSLADLPALALEVETEAQALAAQTEVTPALIADVGEFSADALRLSGALQAAGVGQDMPCVFRDIAGEARLRMVDLKNADTARARAEAFADLRLLLDDASLIAPLAAAAAADRAVSLDAAPR
jgi:hypothetical protein